MAKKLSSKQVKGFLTEVAAITQTQPEVAAQFTLVPKAAAKVGGKKVCVKWGFDPKTGEMKCLKYETR